MKKILSALILVAGLALAGPAMAAAPVDVNTASAEELQVVKGIGPKTAAAIIEYRESHDGFGSVDELVEVNGIGEKTLEKLRAHVTAGERASK